MAFGFAPPLQPRLQRPNIQPPGFPGDADATAQQVSVGAPGAKPAGAPQTPGGQPAPASAPQPFSGVQSMLSKLGFGSSPTPTPADPTAPPVTLSGINMPQTAQVGSSQPLTLDGLNLPGAASDAAAGMGAAAGGGSFLSSIAALFGG